MIFHKYHGSGNDFILIDARNIHDLSNLLQPDNIKYWCRRKYGIGADGVIALTNSNTADLGMKLFNADGSSAEISGNGLRCLALFIKDLGLTLKNIFTEKPRGEIPRWKSLEIIASECGCRPPISDESISPCKVKGSAWNSLMI